MTSACHFAKHDVSCICMLSACAACTWHCLLSFLFACIVGLPEKLRYMASQQVQVGSTDVIGLSWSLPRVCKIGFAMFSDWVQVILYIPFALKGWKKQHGFALCMWEDWFAPCLSMITISLWWRLHLTVALGRTVAISSHTFVIFFWVALVMNAHCVGWHWKISG